jgi:hypothetical protein
MNKIFIGLLLLLGFIILINKSSRSKENFNQGNFNQGNLNQGNFNQGNLNQGNSLNNQLLIDHDNYEIKDKTETIKYDYENGLTNADKRFLLEQEMGMDLTTYHNNKWINHIDENGEPVYLTSEQVTGEPSIIIENKIKNTWDFNKPKISNPDGYIEPNQGKTIREVYDNSILDYKKLVVEKEMIENKNYSKGASSLSYYTPDKWSYNNEKMENGGSNNGLFANDPATTGSVAIF